MVGPACVLGQVSACGRTTTSERPPARPSSGETSALERGSCTRAALSCWYGVKAASAGSAIHNMVLRSHAKSICQDGALQMALAIATSREADYVDVRAVRAARAPEPCLALVRSVAASTAVLDHSQARHRRRTHELLDARLLGRLRLRVRIR